MNGKKQGFILFIVAVLGATQPGETGAGMHSVIRDEMESWPVMQTIKAHDPVTYANFQKVIDAQFQAGTNHEDIVLTLTKGMNDLGIAHLPKASSAALEANYRLLVEQLRILERENPDLCVGLLGYRTANKPPLKKVQDLMPDDFTKRKMTILNSILQSSYTNPAPIEQDLSHALLGITTIRAELMKTYTREDIELMDAFDVPLGKEETLCRLNADFYATALLLRDEEKIGVLRLLSVMP